MAENSTLADVLNAVRQKTGAVIESPPSAARERVVISIGPAPANDVLTALLNGSKFDYIILGSQHGSGAPQHVILREQQSLPAGGAQPVQSTMTAPVRHVPPEAPDFQEEEEFVPEPEVTEEIQPEPVAEPATDQHGQPQSEQPQVKTPEQMLEELRRMQQQQLQQQQQQPGTQPQGNEQQQPQNQQQPQDQQQQPQQTVPDNEPPIVNDQQ